MFSRRVTSVARPAQYKSSRSEGSSGLIAEQKISMSPEPTASPAERSSDAKSTSTLTKPVRSKEGRSRAVRSKPVRSKPVRSGTGGDLLQIVPHHIEVVAFLQHVVQLTCAVGGEHHDRRALRLDRADLRDGDLEVGEDFE